jgi:pimeloyl-ACP methyl ester carboxylesterase
MEIIFFPGFPRLGLKYPKIVKLKNGKFVLVGYSAGAIDAIDLARKKPELVERLILIAPAGLAGVRSLLEHNYCFLKQLFYLDVGLVFRIIVDIVRSFMIDIKETKKIIEKIISFDLEEALRELPLKMEKELVMYWDDKLFPSKKVREGVTALFHKIKILEGGHFALFE